MAVEGCVRRIQTEDFDMIRISSAEKLAAEKLQQAMRAEIHLLRSLPYSQAVCWVQTMGSFRAITQAEPFFGYWIPNPKTGRDSKERARFEEGFVMSYGSHHFTYSVWVGGTLWHLEELCTTLGIVVADESLSRLVQYGQTVHFVRPDFPQQCPVYRVTREQAASLRIAGYETEVEVPEGKKRKWRQVQTGDQLLPLPLGGDWPRHLLVFPSDWLPEERYRRV